jgi:hypothetical protein
MKAILLLTRVDGDENGIGHVTTIAHELCENSTVKDILAHAKHFAGCRVSLDGVKMEILELKSQEEEQDAKIQ